MRLSYLLIILLLALTASATAGENLSPTLKTRDFTLEVLTAPDGQTVEIVQKGGWPKLVAVAGQSYTLKLTNTTNERISIIASIDGLDPSTGKKAYRGQRGTVLGPGMAVEITHIHGPKSNHSLQFNPEKPVGVIVVAAFRERMDYPHLLPWSAKLADRVGGEVRHGLRRGELLWLPPSGADFRKLTDEPSSAAHLEYGAELSFFTSNNQRRP